VGDALGLAGPVAVRMGAEGFATVFGKLGWAVLGHFDNLGKCDFE
jgi:hypothetical protein